MAALQTPPPGLGRKVPRPKDLEGLPREISVEGLTGEIVEDFKTFQASNPQYPPNLAWDWFKDIRRRCGTETADSDWPGDPAEIGHGGSQPNQRNPFTHDPNDPQGATQRSHEGWKRHDPHRDR